MAVHPFCDRKLPIVFDDFVDMNFGTGEPNVPVINRKTRGLVVYAVLYKSEPV